ncbi:MAG: hypothetical protein J6Q65_01925 [Lentisphaeria bacterium]|nr:hypothetical protein [Lentisphaeria bacterium]
MTKTFYNSLLTIALAVLLSACMTQAEKDFRAMSAVRQMEDVKNISWSEKQGSFQVIYFVSFGERPVALYTAQLGKGKNCGEFEPGIVKVLPFFHMPSPIISIPGLDRCRYEKIPGKENTFLLTPRSGNGYPAQVTFDAEGRIAEVKFISTQQSCEITVTVKRWNKTAGKDLPEQLVVKTPIRTEEWICSDWKIDQTEPAVRKIIEENKKQSNNKTIKERSNP